MFIKHQYYYILLVNKIIIVINLICDVTIPVSILDCVSRSKIILSRSIYNMEYEFTLKYYLGTKIQLKPRMNKIFSLIIYSYAFQWYLLLKK